MKNWICEDCKWSGDYKELNRDCNGNEICPNCCGDGVWHKNDLVEG